MHYLLFFIGIIFFVISLLAFSASHFSVWDLQLVEYLATIRTEPINKAAIFLAAVGGMPFVLLITLFWCIHRARYKAYADVVFIVLGVAGSIASVWLMKVLISRPRPPEIYHLATSYGDSFPSGHSMYAAALACLAIYVSRTAPSHRLVVCLAILWMLIMGVSRVYLGVHYPSDVLAGWSMGLIWISLLYGMYCKLTQSNTYYFR